MKEIRAYIIDTHVLVRQTITHIIKNTRGIVLAGSSGSVEWKMIGRNIDQSKPDVILLGIDHRQSPQLEIFNKIRSVFPKLPVIVITPLNSEGAEMALNALKKGAVDFITKPFLSTAMVLARRHFEKRVLLLQKIVRRLNLDALSKPDEKPVDFAAAHQPIPQQQRNSRDLIVIGGCTGGVQALYSLISQLPASLPVPVVVVQHMPKIYTKVFAEDLNRVTPLYVKEVDDSSLLLPGRVYVAPGSKHVIVKSDGVRNRLSLHSGAKEQKCRPSIDVFFRSVSRIYSDKVLGIMLSGGGRDGLEGMEMLAEKGGKILLQDEKSALLWDLPRAIYKRVDKARICPLHDMGHRLGQYLGPVENGIDSNHLKTNRNLFRNRTGMFNYSEI